MFDILIRMVKTPFSLGWSRPKADLRQDSPSPIWNTLEVLLYQSVHIFFTIWQCTHTLQILYIFEI